MSENAIDQFWGTDPELLEIMNSIQDYESWVETDASTVSEMDDAVRKVLFVVDKNVSKLSGSFSSERMDALLESMLVVLGFMPAKRALYYLSSFQEYQPFFESLADKLNESPPLRSYAKTILGRAQVLQQRQLQMSVNSEENFKILTQALERVFNEDK